MVKEYKEVTEPSSIGSTYNPELVNKLNKYCSKTGIKRTELVTELIEKELKGKILTNDFIELEKPFYFNMKELLEKGTVEASTKKPSSDLYNEIIIKAVPNNIDTFEEKLKTYCYDNDSKLHRGIITFLIKEEVKIKNVIGYDEENETEVVRTITKSVAKTVYLLFDYFSAISKDHFITFEKPTLKVSLLTVNELPVLLDNSKDVLATIEKEIDSIQLDNLYKVLATCLLWKYNNTEIINYFHLEKNPYHAYNILKAVFTSSAEAVDVALDLLHSVIIRTVELLVEAKTLAYKDSSEDKSITDVFKEAVIEVDFYNKINNLPSGNAEKVYNIFSNGSSLEDNSFYMATYDRLIHYTEGILKANEEDNIYTFIEAFPFDIPIFHEYQHLKNSLLF